MGVRLPEIDLISGDSLTRFFKVIADLSVRTIAIDYLWRLRWNFTHFFSGGCPYVESPERGCAAEYETVIGAAITIRISQRGNTYEHLASPWL